MNDISPQQIAEALEEHRYVNIVSWSVILAEIFLFLCLLDRIPYVRFDGQMSAKRRQETLERFSLPLEDDSEASPEPSLPPTRPCRTSTQPTLLGDSIDVDDKNDADFTVNGISDEDDFLDDEDDDSPFASKARTGRSKRKAKGKAKAKSAGRSSARAGFNGSSFAGENPKVMLISLKAGALGLNLTVANNVYL